MPITAALLVPALLTGCENGDSPARSERKTVDAYISALNSRDAPALLKLDGAEGREATEQVQEIITQKGGKGLRVQNVRIVHDFGPDVASARIIAKDSKGNEYRERLTLTRDDEGASWHVTLVEAPQHSTGKPTSGTSRP
ncbi:hypothetical protein ABT112_30425 [Streptomyces sp. NPDC002055]|uniref:hypothetical protein n=1 Tax=Streptomyces sp. NPDC002055 TaxID=3154534 RepID=UPI00332BDE1A